MSMSMHVTAFRPPDARWAKMKAIFDACEGADVTIPAEVQDFFNGDVPDAKGIQVDIRDLLQPWADDSREGLQLELARLPAGVTVLCFYNSW